MVDAVKTETLEVDELFVQVVRSRRKTLSLEINHEGVKARAPMRMGLQAIAEFIKHKRHWIDKHLHHAPAPLEPLRLITGAQLLLEGEALTLQLMTNQAGSARLQTLSDHRQLILPIKASHLNIETSTKNKLVRWYKKIAVEKLEDRRAVYAKTMAVPPHKNKPLKVREYKRRWGSCDATGVLSFNWRIIMAPPAVLDYVVVHELAHCHEFNHSRRFWHLVEQQLPEWRAEQAWLQHNGVQLYRF